MKEIQLTQGQVALVDDEDFEWLNQWKWQAAWQKNIQSYYAVRTTRLLGFRKTIMMHREIMKTPDGLQCDHISHNTLDNRKCQLRNCTRGENQRNRKGATAKSKSGILGVYLIRGRYEAGIKRNNKYIRLGSFKNIEDAIEARKKAETD